MNSLNIDLSNTADDDFFGSLKGSKSSKLQQLFVDDSLSADDKDQSLKYQHPKDVISSSSSASRTLIAKVVTAYKQGELQGKVGLALIQNPDNVYSIIIYKTKENILATLKIQHGIVSFYKQNIYWQFYDETNSYWSFSFDNIEDEKEFTRSLVGKHIKYKETHEKEHVTEQSPLHFPNFEKVAHDEEYKSTITTKETKNSLIKRMAKMGKPLPTMSLSHQITTEYSDSSDTEVIQSHLPKTSMAPRSNKLTTSKPNQQLVSSYVDLNSVASSVFPINRLESQYMQMLLTEQRTQGSEIRMNMTKLENKIEKVLDKIELYDRNDVKRNIGKDDEILELEERLLTLKKENRKLKQNLQHSLEQSKENQMQEILFECKEDLTKLNVDYRQSFKNVLFELCDKVKQSNNAMQNMEEKIISDKKDLEKTSWELKVNIKEHGELENEISFLNQRENELKSQLNRNEAEIIQQKNEILELKEKLLEKNQEKLENPNDALLKSVMNNLFDDISNKLKELNFSHSETILSLIKTSIKQQTLKALEQNIN